MNQRIYDIAFSFDESITPIEKVVLFKKFKSSSRILNLNINTIRNILGRRWTGKRYNPDVFIDKTKKILPFIDKAGIKILRFDCNDFPFGLKNIPDMPFMIYYRGNINFDFNKSIAVVGTRKPDENGFKNTQRFVSKLANKGFTIISGLAHGIDSSAHYNCINNSGNTIAVLGCGIDTVYPAANKNLAVNIIQSGGGIISEYPPGIRPNRWNFPRRNRIIVGLSRGVLIIQAPSKSGSLITAMLSADYNRELFVVSPKNKSKINEGNRELIFTGANKIINPNDISFEF